MLEKRDTKQRGRQLRRPQALKLTIFRSFLFYHKILIYVNSKICGKLLFHAKRAMKQSRPQPRHCEERVQQNERRGNLPRQHHRYVVIARSATARRGNLLENLTLFCYYMR